MPLKPPFQFNREVKRFMALAGQYPQNDYIQSVQKLINDSRAAGHNPCDAEKMAFFVPINKKRQPPLFEDEVMCRYRQLKTKPQGLWRSSSRSDTEIFLKMASDINRERQNSKTKPPKTKPVTADQLRKIWQRAKGRYIW